MPNDEELDAYEASQAKNNILEYRRKERDRRRSADRVVAALLEAAEENDVRAAIHDERARGWRWLVRSLRGMWRRDNASQCRSVAAKVTKQGYVTNGDWADLSRYQRS